MFRIVSEPTPGQSKLIREQILAALNVLNRALAQRGVMGEICRFGGAVMVLAFNARLATKDVDAVFEPATVVRDLARQVGESAGLPANWLNDGVKGYLSARHEVTSGLLPQFDHLRLTMPTAEYLLAMKCLASRVGAGAWRNRRHGRHRVSDRASPAGQRQSGDGHRQRLVPTRANSGQGAVKACLKKDACETSNPG